MQRSLAAKNMSHARAGTILAGYLKFTPLWLLILPGMVSRILFPGKLIIIILFIDIAVLNLPGFTFNVHIYMLQEENIHSIISRVYFYPF